MRQWSDKKFSVPTVTLETLLKLHNITHCHLLKLDIEGAEYAVLEKVTPGTFRKIDSMLIEFHKIDDTHYSFKWLKQLLKKHGYTKMTLHPSKPILYCYRP